MDAAMPAINKALAEWAENKIQTENEEKYYGPY
jgi:hypothetical protein